MTILDFKVVVVGMGVQGNKRARFANKDLVATVDNNKKADYNDIEEIDDNIYDAVLLCTPDEVKYELLKKIINKKKHVLVEKPLFVDEVEKIIELQSMAIKNKVILYTAYNHRFEPHFVNMKSVLDTNEIGKIYRIRMFYGNGTSGLVKQSPWRDKGSGVVLDIGSHLIDTIIYWFGENNIKIIDTNSFSFENSSPDHSIIKGKIKSIFFELEVSLLSWRNNFVCDIIGDKGSVHINSLCKWGPSKFIKRKRVFPSGKPDEKITTLIQDDPTWKDEYTHFKNLIEKEVNTDLSVDIKIFNILKNCI